MPTDRFYHLPRGKRLAIREASIREFTRVPLEQVSINRIVKAAGISRGSFYTYFEDKRDVMTYLLEDITGKMEQVCLVSLRARKGDCFLMLEDAFEYIASYMSREDHIRLYHNLLINSDLFGRILSGEIPRERGLFHCPSFGRLLYERADLESRKYRQPVKERFDLLLEVSGSLMMRCAGEHCYGNGSLEEAKQKFHEKLELLKSLVYEEPTSVCGSERE